MKARLFWHVFCAAHWFDICNEIMQSLYCSKFPFTYEKWLLSGTKVRLLSLLATNLEPYLRVTHIRLGNPHRAYIIWEKTRAKITDD